MRRYTSIYLFATKSRATLGYAQTPVQWIPRALTVTTHHCLAQRHTSVTWKGLSGPSHLAHVISVDQCLQIVAL
jgi:hypothetical protein